MDGAITTEGYHDREVIGSFYDKDNEGLIIQLTQNETVVFNKVVQFELNFFSDQNVLFEIKRYSPCDLPQSLFEDYPFLKNYVKNRSENFIIYYLHASVGMSGIIVTR